MAVLADTSVLIDIDVLDLGSYRTDLVIVSAISLGELASGLDVASVPESEARLRRFRAVLDGYEIVPFGVEEAKLYGALTTLVRAAGRNPRPRRLDLQIAATAGAARIPLLTRNPADFVGIDRLVDVVPIAPATT